MWHFCQSYSYRSMRCISQTKFWSLLLKWVFSILFWGGEVVIWSLINSQKRLNCSWDYKFIFKQLFLSLLFFLITSVRPNISCLHIVYFNSFQLRFNTVHVVDLQCDFQNFPGLWLCEHWRVPDVCQFNMAQEHIYYLYFNRK